MYGQPCDLTLAGSCGPGEREQSCGTSSQENAGVGPAGWLTVYGISTLHFPSFLEDLEGLPESFWIQVADSDEDGYDDMDDDDLNSLLNKFVENAPDAEQPTDEAVVPAEPASGEPALVPVPAEPSAAAVPESEATNEASEGQADPGEPLPLEGPKVEALDKAIFEETPPELKDAFRPIPTPNRLMLKYPVSRVFRADMRLYILGSFLETS